MILRTLTALAAPAGRNSRLSVFYFHRVLERPDPLLPSEPDARMFDQILRWIGAQFTVLDPLDACERLVAGTLPARPAVISFDDGYMDNHDVALPLLRKHQMPAVFFIATGFLEGGAMFNDRVIEAIRNARSDSIAMPTLSESLPSRLALGSDAERRAAIGQILRAIKHFEPGLRDEHVRKLEASVGYRQALGSMMTPKQVQALHASGMRVGGHTRTHPILCATSDAQAEEEIVGSLEDLTAITGERPSLFAYPNGKRGSDYDDRHVRILEHARCAFAFSTRAGAAHRATPPLEIPRFTPWNRTSIRFGVHALKNILTTVHRERA